MKVAKPARTAVIVAPCGCLFAWVFGDLSAEDDPPLRRIKRADMVPAKFNVCMVYASERGARRALARMKAQRVYFTCRHYRRGVEAAVAC